MGWQTSPCSSCQPIRAVPGRSGHRRQEPTGTPPPPSLCGMICLFCAHTRVVTISNLDAFTVCMPALSQWVTGMRRVQERHGAPQTSSLPARALVLRYITTQGPGSHTWQLSAPQSTDFPKLQFLGMLPAKLNQFEYLIKEKHIADFDSFLIVSLPVEPAALIWFTPRFVSSSTQPPLQRPNSVSRILENAERHTGSSLEPYPTRQQKFRTTPLPKHEWFVQNCFLSAGGRGREKQEKTWEI